MTDYTGILTPEEIEFVERIGKTNLIEVSDADYKRYISLKYFKILEHLKGVESTGENSI